MTTTKPMNGSGSSTRGAPGTSASADSSRDDHRGSRSTGAGTMEALVQDRYGSPDVLHLATVAMPTAGRGQVRVRVAAASINARDWHIMRGEPRVARLLDRTVFGRTGPRIAVRGTDFAGTVDAVGEGVEGWRPGDQVFGDSDGTLAEFVVAAAHGAVARMPAGISFEQAAALPLAATTAMTCLRAAQSAPSGRILINGASGGVGTFAVQMAKAMGLHVTGVCSARNADLAGSLGADVIIDYNRQDFGATSERYDIVLDLVGNRSIRELRALAHPSGTLVLSGGGVSGEGRFVGPLGLVVRGQVMARLPGARITIPQATPTHEGLTELAGFISSERIAPVIDRIYDLQQAADAIRYMETEHARAKVVVTVSHQGPDNEHDEDSHDL